MAPSRSGTEKETKPAEETHLSAGLSAPLLLLLLLLLLWTPLHKPSPLLGHRCGASKAHDPRLHALDIPVVLSRFASPVVVIRDAPCRNYRDQLPPSRLAPQVHSHFLIDGSSAWLSLIPPSLPPLLLSMEPQ